MIILIKEDLGSTGITSVVDLFEQIITKAVNLAASDIHLESTTNNLRVRYRLDGILKEIIYYYQTWFGMLMEYRLGKYETCWHCGCDDIQKEIKYTVGGFKKFHYTCKKCGEFWVKNHCGHQSGHHTLIKHFNNYHKQVERDHSWYVVCPVCKDGDINPN